MTYKGDQDELLHGLPVVLCNILEMADVETPNNRATSTRDLPDSFTDRSAMSERGRRWAKAARGSTRTLKQTNLQWRHQ